MSEDNIQTNQLDDILDDAIKNTVQTQAKKKIISKEFVDKMNAQNEYVKHAYTIFKHCYKTAVKPIFVSDIIDGEVIETHEDNIMVTDPIEEEYQEDLELFERMTKVCTKHLYKYQKDAILKLRELELRGNVKMRNKRNAKTMPDNIVISNGYLLSLPIGSGKSLVFQFLALLYRNVPTHPIVISTDGRNVPIQYCSDLKTYPYYYENCGYIANKANGVVVVEDYVQQRCTVILTHLHLIGQMKEYFETDFPLIVKRTRIQYAISTHEVKDIASLDILVIVATAQNVEELMKWSYSQPFMRVIIDDYTSMDHIESFRQIRASSTIFVSGSGFNRKESDIPSSYYTLKHMPVKSITLVGKPEDTYEGIFRDSIATMQLMGSSCTFSQYRFVNDVEELCKGMFKASPDEVYPAIKSRPTLQNYIALMFVLRNWDRVKSAIINVEKDLVTENPKTGKPILERSKLKYYFLWKEMLESTGKTRDGIRKNPMYNALYLDNAVGTGSSIPLVSGCSCMCCQKKFSDHCGYGVITNCCGAFYCNDCIKNITTNVIYNSKTGEHIVDHDKVYCSCCRHINPTVSFNVSKRKDVSVYAFSMADEAFEVEDLKNRPKFEYYFYMFLYGFTPLYNEGKHLNILNDIEQGAVESNVFKQQIIPTLDTILPKDQLCILTLSNINTTLGLLGITPKMGSIILFYKAPQYMQTRIAGFYKDIILQKNEKTMVPGIMENGRRGMVQPISQCTVVFKNNVSQLIGMHQNIIGTILWEDPGAKDLELQILGRCYRINNWGNNLTFYISASSDAYN